MTPRRQLNGVALWTAFLAAAQSAVASAALADLLSKRTLGLLGMTVSVLLTGTSAYHAYIGQHVPYRTVESDLRGRSGPAA